MEELDYKALVKAVKDNLDRLQIVLDRNILPEFSKPHRHYQELSNLNDKISTAKFFTEMCVKNLELLEKLKDLDLLIKINITIYESLPVYEGFKANYNSWDENKFDKLFSNLSNHLNEIINQLRELNIILSSMSFNQIKSSMDSELSIFKGKADIALIEFGQKFEYISDYEQRVKKSTENIEGLSASLAGEVQANFFKKNYAIHETENVIWFIFITALISGLCYSILHFEEIYSINLPLMMEVKTLELNLYLKYKFYLFLLSKISFVFVLLLAIYFCMKNFNANKHNAILNKHRSDSLLTYKAILDVAGADKQDIILTQISECMFKHQDTGFGKLDDSGPSWEQVINLLTKTVGKSKEGG